MGVKSVKHTWTIFNVYTNEFLNLMISDSRQSYFTSKHMATLYLTRNAARQDWKKFNTNNPVDKFVVRKMVF